MAFSQISTSVSIISSGLKGYQAISLTQFVTSAQSLIASGSAIEIANAFFLANGNITPNASSWTAVTTANTAYIALTPSGSAGSQVLAAVYTDTAPTWVLSKAGWYASAASLTRYAAGVTKTSATQYDGAFILGVHQDYGMAGIVVGHEAGNFLKVKVVEIGEWNMDTTASVSIAHGMGATFFEKVRTTSAMIRADAGGFAVNLASINTGTAHVDGGVQHVDETIIFIDRSDGGRFDGPEYNATAGTVANRGWVTIWYES